MLVRNITRWSVSTERKNKDLIKCLRFIGGRAVTATELRTYMAWTSPTTARKVVRQFIDDGLVEYAGEVPAGLTTCPTYQLLPGALEDAIRLYPTERPDHYSVLTVQRVVSSGISGNARKEQIVTVQRDPLTTMLMGAGPAPSLNFKDSSEA
jgi:hypothetical protein